MGAASRPPLETRLRVSQECYQTRLTIQLYALFKQATEGDASGLPRPPADPSAAHDAPGQQKWDAWNSLRGMAKYTARTQYIDLLITSAKRHIPEANFEQRSLIEELDFMWQQIAPAANASAQVTPQGTPRFYEASEMPYGQSPMPPDRLVLEAPASMDAGAGERRRAMATGVAATSSQPAAVDSVLRAYASNPSLQRAFADSQAGSPRSLSRRPRPTRLIDSHVGNDDEDDESAVPFREPEDAYLEAKANEHRLWRQDVEHALLRLITEMTALREELFYDRYMQRSSSRVGRICKVG